VNVGIQGPGILNEADAPILFSNSKEGAVVFASGGWMMPIFNNFAMCFSASSQWVSGILNCLM